MPCGIIGHMLLLTADDARRRSAALVPWLARRGAGAGDRLVLALPAYDPAVAADLICAVWGALRVGVIPVVLDAAAGERELAELTADADPVAVLDSAAELAAALDGEPAEVGTTPLGRPMYYTSGTTGRRKGVYSGALSPAAGAALWDEERTLWGMRADDVHIVMSPLHHSAPLRFALVSLLAGGSAVLAGRFAVDGWLDACEELHPTTTFTAPAQLQHLRARGDERVLAALKGFRLLAHAGAPCPEPVKRWLLDHLDPDRVFEFYGSTEGQFTACPGSEWLAHPGTVGRARPGRELSLDEDGRIWCTAPEHARFSYWRAPEKTEQAWRGSSFSVGDAGRLDADGYLYLHGRRDDLIISGGVNVYPAEVERVLDALPGVLEVAVFGVPDERWGQRVEAAVTAAPGARLDADELLAAAAAELPPARRPKRVHVIEAFPRTSTGKILRRELPTLCA